MARNIDALIAESQEIRDDLLKTIGKLEAFSDALTIEASRLREEVTTNARDHEAEIGSSDTPNEYLGTDD